MRLAFMGTPEFSAPVLAELVAAGHEVAAVYTRAPQPSGRGHRLTPSPVHRLAESFGIEVRTPKNFKAEEDRAAFAALDLDVAIVVAYGLILPQAVLDAPRHGCLNLHASLLPRWRGAAPIQRAIMAGDQHTGVQVMQMEAGLDTGPMLTEQRTPLPGKTAGELTAELAEMGARLIVEVLADLPAFAPHPQPDDGVTYARKIEKAEARLDFAASAEQAERQVRAFAPAPGAFFELEGERYKVLAAEVASGSGTPGAALDDVLTIACGSGAIRPTRIQRAGRPAMDTRDLLRGKPIPAGTKLA